MNGWVKNDDPLVWRGIVRPVLNWLFNNLRGKGDEH